MNYKRGLFRLWLVFSVCWCSYFGWQAYESNRDYNFWAPQVSKQYELLNKSGRAYEKAPNWHENGMDKRYYKAEFEQYQSRFDEAVRYRDVASAKFETAGFFGPVVPFALLVGYFVVVFIARGFKVQESNSVKTTHHPPPASDQENPARIVESNGRATQETNLNGHQALH